MKACAALLLLLLLSSTPALAQETRPQAPATDSRPRVVPSAAAAQPTPTPARPAPTPAASPSVATRQPATTNPTPQGQTQTTPAGATRQMPAANPPAAQSPSPAPVVVPALPAAAAPLQPTRTVSPNKIRAHREEAQRLMRSRVSPTAMPSLTFVTLAVLDPEDSRIHQLTLPKETFLRAGSEVTIASSHGMPLRLRVLRPNYVNTAVVVSDLTGRQLTPLLVEYPIEKFGRYRETAYYTSAHPALVTPELVKQGQAYVRTMVDLAAKRLKDKGFHMTPEVIDMAERLCIVEHVDHSRFNREHRKTLLEEVYALYALNELDTYRYSVSSAGAGGMVQMIAPTYQFLRQRYPTVGLNPDFVAGMRNHGNALEAMLLYIRDTWSDLNQNGDVAGAYATGLAKRDELIAAGYNSNPARLGGYIRRGGTAWRTLIPRETQMYLQILSAFNSFTPIKPRADRDAGREVKADAPGGAPAAAAAPPSRD